MKDDQFLVNLKHLTRNLKLRVRLFHVSNMIIKNENSLCIKVVVNSFNNFDTQRIDVLDNGVSSFQEGFRGF